MPLPNRLRTAANNAYSHHAEHQFIFLIDGFDRRTHNASIRLGAGKPCFQNGDSDPQSISWPHRISPFAHALVGISRFSGGDFHDRSAAFAVGVGVDYHVSGRFSWRVIQADALTTRLGGRDEHNTRISTGIVFRF